MKNICKKNFKKLLNFFLLFIVFNSFCLLEIYYRPQDNIRKIIIDYILEEKESIKCAMYYLTDSLITKALIAASKKNVQIELVLDSASYISKFEKVSELIEHKIQIYIFNSIQISQYIKPIMHNKFIIFQKNKENKSITITGSFNYTVSASIYNYENILITDDLTIIEKLAKYFEYLKIISKQITNY